MPTLVQGFVFPRTADVNPDADIEWELGFHRAETFIMRSLHYPKLRVYLFSVLLYKAYFEAFEVQKNTGVRKPRFSSKYMQRSVIVR